MNRQICIVGGGAVLAQPLIRHFLVMGDKIHAICRNSRPTSCHPNLRVYDKELPEGPLDVLITMAGRVENSKLCEMTTEQWGKVIDDTLGVVFDAFRQLLPKMNYSSNVIVFGSIVGSIGGYGCANYAAAKAGLVGLVRAASNEYSLKKQMCINLLELGYIDSGMGTRLGDGIKEKILPRIPLGRFGTEEDVVLAIDFLSHTRFMTGGILTLSGGLQ